MKPYETHEISSRKPFITRIEPYQAHATVHVGQLQHRSLISLRQDPSALSGVYRSDVAVGQLMEVEPGAEIPNTS